MPIGHCIIGKIDAVSPLYRNHPDYQKQEAGNKHHPDESGEFGISGMDAQVLKKPGCHQFDGHCRQAAREADCHRCAAQRETESLWGIHPPANRGGVEFVVECDGIGLPS